MGLKKDQEAFFKKMQVRGLVQFLAPQTNKVMAGSSRAASLIDAIKILRKMPKIEQVETPPSDKPQTIATSVVKAQELVDRLEDEIKGIDAEMGRIAPLGDFSLAKIKELELKAGRQVQFFCIKKDKLHQVDSIGEYIYIASDFDLDFFMSIAKERKRPEFMLEVRLEQDLATLKLYREEKAQELKEKRAFLRESAALTSWLSDSAIDELNVDSRAQSAGFAQPQLEKHLFSVEGWMPAYKAKEIMGEFKNLGILIEEIPVAKGEREPTYMTNKGVAHIGEDLVHIYDTPSPQDKDPSMFVFFSFIIFYAIIISDAGYGMLYAILAFFLGWKMRKSKQGSVKRFIKLFKVIAFSTITWGILAGSYFGIDLPPSNPLTKVSMLDALARKKADYHIAHKDETYQEWIEKIPALKEAKTGREFLDLGIAEKDGKMRYEVLGDFKDSLFLEIALILGILHICIALFYSVRQHFSNIGWVLAVIGGYLYFPDMLSATSIVYFLHLITPTLALSIGRDLMLGGLGLAVVLALVQHRLGGLMSIAKVIELFADVLSYLRLYALGLAGMILASTFNDMGLGLMDSFGVIVGSIVIVLGHMINIVVGIMGGTIHGLRLNFIEWYHHCFEGGGKLFQPLKLLTKRR